MKGRLPNVFLEIYFMKNNINNKIIIKITNKTYLWHWPSKQMSKERNKTEKHDTEDR